jgi:hypothetical protein
VHPRSSRALSVPDGGIPRPLLPRKELRRRRRRACCGRCGGRSGSGCQHSFVRQRCCLAATGHGTLAFHAKPIIIPRYVYLGTQVPEVPGAGILGYHRCTVCKSSSCSCRNPGPNAIESLTPLARALRLPMMGVGENRGARGGHEAAAFGQCYRMQLSSGVYDRCDLAGTSSADAYGCVWCLTRAGRVSIYLSTRDGGADGGAA